MACTASPGRDGGRKKKLAALRKCTVELSESMNAEDMTTTLYANNMLTKDEVDELRIPQSTRNRNLYILLKVPSKGLRAFDYFVDALQATSWDNPSHKELVDLLMKTLNNSN